MVPLASYRNLLLPGLHQEMADAARLGQSIGVSTKDIEVDLWVDHVQNALVMKGFRSSKKYRAERVLDYSHLQSGSYKTEFRPLLMGLLLELLFVGENPLTCET